VHDNEQWVCPACEWPNLNLHKHFVVLGLLFGLVAVLGLVMTILYAFVTQDDAAFLFLMWSCVHTTASGYAVMAIFSDRRAYGLKPLRYLLPGLFVSAVAGAITYWFPFHWLTVIIVGIVFAAIGAYGAYVFWHTIRMAVPHRPRELVVRPMYTLISVTVHVLLLLYMALVTVVVRPRTAGTSSVDFGKPGGYVAPMQVEDVEEMEDEDIEIEEEEIDPDLEEIEPPEREDIVYDSETDLVFNKTEIEEKPRIRKKVRHKNIKYEQRYNREYALIQGGGSDRTEWAVLQALRWLKRNQNEDGSWGEPPLQPTMTGWALLCFLGHGEDHLSVEFGATVRSAISWFVGEQDENGYFTQAKSWGYQNGIATYAMAEAYAMTGLEDLRPVVAKAIRRICEGQTPEGGWYYGYAKVRNDGQAWPGGDTSVCGWQIQALTAAWYGGIRFSNNMLLEARRRAVFDLNSRFNQKGGCGYNGTAPSGGKERNYCTTGIGTLCLQFLGQHSSEQVKWGLSLMLQYSCDWKRTTGGAGAPLYGWYYVTQAMYQATANPKQNKYWKYWNPKFSTMLVNKQASDGHWEPPEGGAKNWFSGKNKNIYATTLCCMMLEVYYRYLPTYRSAR